MGKGHWGIFSYEWADVLAKQGASESDPIRETAQIMYKKLPPSIIKTLHRKDLSTGGMNTGSPARTVARLSSGSLPSATRTYFVQWSVGDIGM